MTLYERFLQESVYTARVLGGWGFVLFCVWIGGADVRAENALHTLIGAIAGPPFLFGILAAARLVLGPRDR